MNRDQIVGYRPVLYAIYAVYAFAGVGFLVNPSLTLSDALETGPYLIWTGLLTAGGIFSLIGLALRKHYLEGVALISLVGGLLVYVLALLFSEKLRDDTGVNYGLTLILISTMLMLVMRALVVRDQVKIRERLSEAIHDESN